MKKIHDKKTDKIKEAAALKYSPDVDAAPRIVALGKGETAGRIIETAKENDVSIYHDEQLAHTLNRLRIGDEIPPELYEVVAEVLVFISDADKNFGEKNGSKK
jgi:flagellar biosynthesis protein